MGFFHYATLRIKGDAKLRCFLVEAGLLPIIRLPFSSVLIMGKENGLREG